MKIGFYAGSFDPFTVGHLHIVKTASKLFDKLIIGIGVNSRKVRHFDKLKMKDAMLKTFEAENLKNIEVIIFEGLTADTAKEHNADFLIRGIRNGVDYGEEENLATVNEELSGIDTIYIRAGKYGAISSSMVRELLLSNRDASKYLPQPILQILKQK